jgi:uncharacterized protein
MDNKIVSSSIIAAAIVISAFLLSSVLRDFNKSKQTINVTGSAKRDIVSDLGKLGINISVNAVSQLEGMKEINRQKPMLLEFLKSKGIESEKIKLKPVNSYPVYQIGESGYQTGKIISYNVSQEFNIESGDVLLIENISLEASSLLEKGMNINIYQPEYYYTKLAPLKIEIQSEAAGDAKNRAAKIAEATGRKIGPLTSARMGVLQITPENSNTVSDYGMNDVSSVKKEITAVVNATFLVD